MSNSQARRTRASLVWRPVVALVALAAVVLCLAGRSTVVVAAPPPVVPLQANGVAALAEKLASRYLPAATAASEQPVDDSRAAALTRSLLAAAPTQSPTVVNKFADAVANDASPACKIARDEVDQCPELTECFGSTTELFYASTAQVCGTTTCRDATIRAAKQLADTCEQTLPDEPGFARSAVYLSWSTSALGQAACSVVTTSAGTQSYVLDIVTAQYMAWDQARMAATLDRPAASANWLNDLDAARRRRLVDQQCTPATRQFWQHVDRPGTQPTLYLATIPEPTAYLEGLRALCGPAFVDA
ncbi:hypothetical protein AMAG_18540 [Allomyces macrogynus ATCC 38327]|uniref:Uncharacterized protein n=1 Tax=Allomyces macrogynus (strain ATCC 38327) TaxID=578462 RepID=A0A0L0SD77_ALLM3|nr:hypothetical protein AMAG_18540 [Allomyces macrogynus ATCC 38327]|eukprot:KNE60473.1 hypothetical protein AMAG_18540 [Allomyces macrogynus ATCC 38327]